MSRPRIAPDIAAALTATTMSSERDETISRTPLEPAHRSRPRRGADRPDPRAPDREAREAPMSRPRIAPDLAAALTAQTPARLIEKRERCR